MAVTIYHNPRCSKSRATLKLLQERGIAPEIVEYLKTPPDAATLDGLLTGLGMEPRDLMRKKEAPYTENGLDDEEPEPGSLDRRDGRRPDPDRTPDRGQRRQGRPRPPARGRAGYSVGADLIPTVVISTGAARRAAKRRYLSRTAQRRGWKISPLAALGRNDGLDLYPLPTTATHSISTSRPSCRSLGEVTAVEAGMLPVNASERPREYSA